LPRQEQFHKSYRKGVTPKQSEESQIM